MIFIRLRRLRTDHIVRILSVSLVLPLDGRSSRPTVVRRVECSGTGGGVFVVIVAFVGGTVTVTGTNSVPIPVPKRTLLVAVGRDVNGLECTACCWLLLGWRC